MNEEDHDIPRAPVLDIRLVSGGQMMSDLKRAGTEDYYQYAGVKERILRICVLPEAGLPEKSALINFNNNTQPGKDHLLREALVPARGGRKHTTYYYRATPQLIEELPALVLDRQGKEQLKATVRRKPFQQSP